MQPKTWMTLFDKRIFHLITFVQNFGGNLNPTDHHLLILDGHNSHVTLDVVYKTMGVGLDLITLPSHISCALQPFDVSCFKPFNAPLNSLMDSIMSPNGENNERIRSWGHSLVHNILGVKGCA